MIKTISVKVVEDSHASLLVPSLSVLSVIRLGHTVPDHSTLSLIYMKLCSLSFGWATPFLIIRLSFKFLQLETMLPVWPHRSWFFQLGFKFPQLEIMFPLWPHRSWSINVMFDIVFKFLQLETMFPVIWLGHTIPDHSTLFQVFEIHYHEPKFWPLKCISLINFDKSKHCCAYLIIMFSGSAYPPVCDQSWNWLPLVGGILTCQHLWVNSKWYCPKVDFEQSTILYYSRLTPGAILPKWNDYGVNWPDWPTKTSRWSVWGRTPVCHSRQSCTLENTNVMCTAHRRKVQDFSLWVKL